jgi:hypothetical protein
VTYQIHVADNAGFNEPLFDDTAAATNRAPATVFGNGTYYRHVRALNMYAVPGVWSKVRTLTISIPPTLLLHADASTDDTEMPTFSWEIVSDASEYQPGS